MALLSLVEHVSAYFEAHDVPAYAVFGERERVRQGNAKPGPVGGRVSFVLVGGPYTGPGRRGPRAGDGENTVTRAIYQLDGEVEVEVWAWNDANRSDDAVQWEAWVSLHEWTLNAIRGYAEGSYTPSRMVVNNTPSELRRGFSALVYLDLPMPVLKLPAAVKVPVTYTVTVTQVLPQGTTGEGAAIDPIETVVTETSVAPE